MRISSFQPLILLQYSLFIHAHPKILPISLNQHDNDLPKRAVAQVPSILQLLNETRHQLNSNFSSSTSTSLFLADIDFPVKGTPVDLDITLQGRSVPQIYISACLTAALRKIAPDVTAGRSAPIPRNRFYYRDRTSRVAFEYIGLIDKHVLTWQQLTWTLFGLLTFVEREEANSKVLSAWVKIKVNKGDEWAIPYGSLTLEYNGNGVTEER